MTKSMLLSALLLAGSVFAGNPQSPSATASVTIGGKAITIKYSAPSMRGRKIFGPGGRISQDPTYPVWRVGADDATALHTDANLMIGSLMVPAGDYTLFAKVDSMPWQLIVSKATGEWGLSYKADSDLGRTPMTMSKPSAPIETFKIVLTGSGGNKGLLQLEWENTIASVPLTVK